MNVGELIEQMREDYLDDDQQPFLWKRSTLLRYLSRAQEQACMRQPLIVDAGTPVDGASVSLCEVTLVTGQLSYPLSDRVVLVNSVTYDDVLLTKHTESELDRCSPGWRLREGAISGYLQNDLTLTLVEAPTVVDNGKKLKLNVWRLPLASFDDEDDVPEIPAQHHEDLMWYALSQAFARPDEDTQDKGRADDYMARFDSVFGPSLRADVLAHRRREAPRSFIGPAHAYHGRRSCGASSVSAFDFED